MKWRLYGGIALLIAALALTDRFLAAMEASEVRSAARHAYLAGCRLWKENRPDAALDELRNAQTLERENPEYERQMVRVLLSLNKTNEADPLVQEMLQKKPNDGAANLLAGRLAAMEADSVGARAYYHRAIFGDWPSEDHDSRVAARLELIRLLAREHDSQQMLSELISLDAAGIRDRAIQVQLARWYLEAGSPVRAAAQYRQLTLSDEDNPTLWAGLGEAELQQGDYRAARTAFEHAADTGRLALVSVLAGLDPTGRRLTSQEKYDRSAGILQMAKADLQRVAPATDSTTPLPGKSVSNEAAEQVLSTAEALWKRRLATGKPLTPEEEPLRLLMEKLAR